MVVPIISCDHVKGTLLSLTGLKHVEPNEIVVMANADGTWWQCWWPLLGMLALGNHAESDWNLVQLSSLQIPVKHLNLCQHGKPNYTVFDARPFSELKDSAAKLTEFENPSH